MLRIALGSLLFVVACSSPSQTAVGTGGPPADGPDGGGNVDGSVPVTPVPPLELASGVFSPCLQANETSVFICQNNKVVRIDLSSSEKTTIIAATPSEIVAQVALTGKTVAAVTADALYAGTVDGNDAKVIFRGRSLHRALAVDTRQAYVLDGTAITRVPVAGGTPGVGRYDLPVHLHAAGAYLYLTELDDVSQQYTVHTLSIGALAKKGAYFSSAREGSTPISLPLLMAGTQQYVYMPAVKTSSTYVELRRMANPPTNNGSQVSMETLGNVTARQAVAVVADERDVFLSTDDAVYRYDASQKQLVKFAAGAPQSKLALNATYLFWFDGQTLRATPR